MDKKMAFRLLAVLLAASCLTGCAGQKLAEETAPVQIEKSIVAVTEEAQTGEKSLSINASVEVPDLSSLEEITLSFDEDLLDTMEKELIHSQYPGLEEGVMDGYRNWSVENETGTQLLFGFSCEDDGFEAGRTYYLDVLRDLNGQDMGEDELNRWTPYYMTEHIPDKLEMNASDAAGVLSEFLGQYSCFDYKPWNIVAVNCRDVPDSSGYYQAMMQPQYEGIPVYGDGALDVSACLSAEGVFTFQGIMVLKEHSRKNADAVMLLEEAVEQFKSDYPEIPHRGNITVDRITVGYVADSHYSGKWTLSPAWVFEYSATYTRQDNQEEAVNYFTCAYRMNDGTLYTFD